MSQNRATAEEPPHVALMQMAAGAWVAQAVTVAAELGLADLVAAEPRPAFSILEAVARA